MKRPWMPLYIADYLADTAHLSAAEHGAYLLLIMHYWTKGELPEDEEMIRRITRLNARQWSQSRDVLRSLFGDGWRHKRIDAEVAKAIEKSSVNSANAKRKRQDRNADAERTHTHARASSQSQSQKKKDAELRSDAGASDDDPRTRLFREGLSKLAAMTGKGPDACRSFIGKCLKSAEDSAVVVLGLIEDAERNRVADPAAWIAARLKTKGPHHGRLQQAADDLLGRIAAFDADADEPDVRGGTGEGAVQLLPPSRRK